MGARVAGRLATGAGRRLVPRRLLGDSGRHPPWRLCVRDRVTYEVTYDVTYDVRALKHLPRFVTLHAQAHGSCQRTRERVACRDESPERSQ